MNNNTEEEKWKDITGYEGRYKISNQGRVYSDVTNIIRKQRLSKGYPVINLTFNGKERTFSVHRLVALHFVENSEDKPEVNHIDENKENNHYTNLMWCTPKENSNWGTRRERVSNTLKLNNIRPFSLKQRPKIKVVNLIKPKREYKKRDKYNRIVVYKNGAFNSKEIYAIDKCTDEIIYRFVSVNAAARFFGLRQSNISDVCAGRVKTTGGYKFKFVS